MQRFSALQKDTTQFACRLGAIFGRALHQATTQGKPSEAVEAKGDGEHHNEAPSEAFEAKGDDEPHNEAIVPLLPTQGGQEDGSRFVTQADLREVIAQVQAIRIALEAAQIPV